MGTDARRERQPSPRVAQKRERARQEILEAAEDILLESGVEAVTLAVVSARLGMTKQALYHYFQSKDALVRSLVTRLVDKEIEALIGAIQAGDDHGNELGTLIRAFYHHYVGRLDAFRTVYCQSQLRTTHGVGIDRELVHDEISPRTRQLFDLLEERLALDSMANGDRERMRQLAFTAWLSALGLVTMLGIADATAEPLIHSDEDLLRTLSGIFGDAAGR